MNQSKKFRRNRHRARPLSEVVSGVLEPILAKRAGMTMELTNAWPDIIGGTLGKHSRPEKIVWPRRISDDDPFKAATLNVACDGAHAIFLQHEMDAILERINTFLGFAAIARIKIFQKPVADLSKDVPQMIQPELNNSEKQRLSDILGDIEDDELRAKLAKLGQGILLRQRKSK